MNRISFIKGLAFFGFARFAPDPFPTFYDFSRNSMDMPDVEKLLSNLNLDFSGIEKIRSLKKNSHSVGKFLLEYFRSRHLIKFPATAKSPEARAELVTPRDLKWANDALEHIFVGQPEYPSIFVGSDINWNTRPVADNEWVWQLNRMYFWDAMARVYQITDDEKYAKEWARQLTDWIKKNPNDEQHLYAWRSIEAGIRGHSWIILFTCFLNSKFFTPQLLINFLNSFYDHATYLMTEYRKGSNWALMEAEGLAFIAIFFPEFKDSSIWRKEAFGRFNREISRQVYKDGFQRELSIGYHVGSINWFLNTFELAKMNGLSTEYSSTFLDRIEKMCSAVMKITMPDGTNAQFGDSWVGTPGQYKKHFEKWAELFNRKDFLFISTDGKIGSRPESLSFALKESGLYSMRSSWEEDAICLVLKCGPDGGGHCQPDNGTFELYAGGRHLMPDSGSYTYSVEMGRNWFRQTSVHQTLTLNGENSGYKPALLLWQPGRDSDKLVVENQSYPSLKHRRAVLFIEKSFFVIIDEAIGDGEGDVDLHFQLLPGKTEMNNDGLSFQSSIDSGWNVLVRTLNQPGIKLEKEEGWVSYIYTKKQELPAFRFRINKQTKDPIRFVTVVSPFIGNVPDFDVKLTDDTKIGGLETSLIIESEKLNLKRRINYHLEI